MRKTGRKVAETLLLTLILTGITAMSALAAEVSDVKGELRPNVTITVDGAEKTFYNAQGQEVHAVYYNGTHYLPIRAIGELMGKNVNWDQAALTISLSGVRTAQAVQGTPDTSSKEQDITLQIRPDFTLMVDGNRRVFTDSSGNTLHPVLYDSVTYLPLRAIGQLMGKEVTWDATDKNIILTTPEKERPLVTDADSFNQTPAAPPTLQPNLTAQTPAAGAITADEAKNIALKHAGLTDQEVTFVENRLDWDDGRQVYELEFYTADYQEYDYEIDAVTGAIVQFDYDAEYYQRPAAPASASGNTEADSYIGEARAKEIALRHAGFTEGQVSFLRCELDRDDGRLEYNVEFHQGGTEYEYEIDAVTGDVLSRDAERDD